MKYPVAAFLTFAALASACRFGFTAQSEDDANAPPPIIDAAGVDSVVVPGDPTFTRPIDIDDQQVSGGPHDGFPLLVSLTESYLRHVSAGGDVAHTSGFDISFSADAARTQQLAHEIESYDSATGALIAWIKIPILTPTTVLYMNYGDPTINASLENAPAVWSQDYVGIWHLLDDFAESSANNNPASDDGSFDTAAQIGVGREFDGVDDWVNAGTEPAIDDIFAGGGTVEAWFNPVGWGESDYGRIFDKGHHSGWSLCVNDNNPLGSLSFLHGADIDRGVWAVTEQSIELGEFQHIAVVYDSDSNGNVPALYLNGVEVPMIEIAPPQGAIRSDALHELYIGNRSALDRTFDGAIDEARLSSTPRSPGWITTGYRNQNDPDSFYEVGSPL